MSGKTLNPVILMQYIMTCSVAISPKKRCVTPNKEIPHSYISHHILVYNKNYSMLNYLLGLRNKKSPGHNKRSFFKRSHFTEDVLALEINKPFT